METDYIAYERMFKGVPQGITFDFKDDKYQEISYIISGFHGLTDKAETILKNISNGQEVVYDEETDSIVIEGAEALIYVNDEITCIIPVTDLEEILKRYIDLCKEKEKKGTVLLKIKPIREILVELRNMVPDARYRLSYPIISKHDGLSLTGIFIRLNDDTPETYQVDKPVLWGRCEMSGTNPQLIRNRQKDPEPEKISVRPGSDIEYSDNYLFSLLDILDSIRYEYLSEGKLNADLYEGYLEQLMEMFSDDIGKIMKLEGIYPELYKKEQAEEDVTEDDPEYEATEIELDDDMPGFSEYAEPKPIEEPEPEKEPEQEEETKAKEPQKVGILSFFSNIAR